MKNKIEMLAIKMICAMANLIGYDVCAIKGSSGRLSIEGNVSLIKHTNTVEYLREAPTNKINK